MRESGLNFGKLYITQITNNTEITDFNMRFAEVQSIPRGEMKEE
jgi:hypothetical protein